MLRNLGKSDRRLFILKIRNLATETVEKISKIRNLGQPCKTVSKSSLNCAMSTKSTASSDRAGQVGVRVSPREASAVKLVVCVHAAHGLLGVCTAVAQEGVTPGVAGEPRARVDDERELETSLLRGVETLFEV